MNARVEKVREHWETKHLGLVTGRCCITWQQRWPFCMLSAEDRMETTGWRKKGGNLLSTDICLNPGREPISGWRLCRLLVSIRAAFGLTTAEQVPGGQASSRTCSYPKWHADEERRSDCICHSCLCEVSAHPSMLGSENHGMSEMCSLNWLMSETDVSLCLFFFLAYLGCCISPATEKANRQQLIHVESCVRCHLYYPETLKIIAKAGFLL